MSQITEIICDQCGARKGKANHWWKSLSTNIFISFRAFDSLDDGKQTDTYKDLCSESCVTKALSEFMNQPITILHRDSSDITKDLNILAEEDHDIR